MADKIKIYQAGNIKIRINRDKCISCGLCAEIASKTFELDDQMVSVVKKNDPYDSKEKITEAIEDCPVEAISVES